MLREHQRFFNLVFQFTDLIIVAVAWLAAYPLRFLFLRHYIPVTKGYPVYDHYAYLTFGIILLWYLVFYFTGVYRSRRTQTVWPEVMTIVRSNSTAFILLAAGTFLTTGELFSRGVLLVFYFASLIMLLSERIILRSVMKGLRRRGFNTRYSIIVGNNEISAAFLERLRYHPELGLKVVGVVELENANLQVGETAVQTKTDLRVLGTSADLSQVLKAYRVDQVVIALKNSQRDQLDQLIASLVDQHVDVRIIPDLQQFVTLGCEVEEFEGMPLISLNQSPIVGWNRVAKRISDILYASVALVVFAPLMGLIAACIKLFSPGPVIHTQERMGLDGRVFRMLKFRTMRVDAEKETGAVWTKKHDDRITPLGRVLRKTSLDELPQLINVLKGDMSCVGPRPERPSLVEKFKSDVPKYMLRHKVKAGMTGWAQVNGWRGDTSLEKRIEYDLYYISNWSLLFDFKIMLVTVFKGFISKNAY